MHRATAALILLAAGCARPEPGYSKFLHDAHVVECAARATCGCPTDDCVAVLDALTADNAAALDSAIADGDLSFDPGVARDCLAGLMSAWSSCDVSAETSRANLQRCYFTIESDTVGETPDIADASHCPASWWCHSGYCTDARTCAPGTVHDVLCAGPTPL